MNVHAFIKISKGPKGHTHTHTNPSDKVRFFPKPNLTNDRRWIHGLNFLSYLADQNTSPSLNFGEEIQSLELYESSSTIHSRKYTF